MPFFFLNPVLSAIFQGAGNSRLPFTINLSGLGANILLKLHIDFRLGTYPCFGCTQATLATSFSQALMTFSYLFVMLNMQSVLTPTFSNGIDWKRSREIFDGTSIWNTGNLVYDHFHCYCTICISILKQSNCRTKIKVLKLKRFLGKAPTVFSAALTALSGKIILPAKKERIWKGYRNTICFSATIGLIAFLLFFFFGKQIFLLFFPSDLRTVEAGNVYLKILSYSPIMMCIEITTSGLFNGIGKTHISIYYRYRIYGS